MTLRQLLEQRISNAMHALGLPSECAALISPARQAGHGDYQANGALAAAKIAKRNPRELATAIVTELESDATTADIIAHLDVAGPGFINITLSADWLAARLLAQCTTPTFKVASPETVVIDYSSPNLAKEMHVGHLRSTIIGDVLARTLEFMGHKVIRQNHVGDWGTQFGMLIAELEDQLQDQDAPMVLQDLERFYQQAKQHFDADPAFAERARQRVVALQSGDKSVLTAWEQFKDISLSHSQAIYEQLDVTLTPEHVHGESAFNPQLAEVVDRLQQQGLAVEDQGAIVVFLDELADKEGNPSPVIIRKKGGGYLYATTDLAALDYRANTLGADRILYFIDARQSLHMKQVFTLARKAKWVPEHTRLEHHAFGTMMGKDGKPFKTRTGGTVKLADLLTEAVERADALIASKNPQMPAEERAVIARIVGIGAVKYADLCKTRTNDYLFDWDSMLSFEGNTAPYLQYAHARICSMFRRANRSLDEQFCIAINTPEEKALALRLLQLDEVVTQLAAEAYPHILCNYLYDCATLFMRFYEACPILKEGIDENTRNQRLGLSQATAKVLATGLNLLGITAPEKM